MSTKFIIAYRIIKPTTYSMSKETVKYTKMDTGIFSTSNGEMK